MSTPPIYGLTGSATYTGATGALPGATNMSAFALVNVTANNASAEFWQNLLSDEGWSIAVGPASASVPGTINLIVQINGDVFTVQIGAVLDEWVLVAFTVEDDELSIYVNGQLALEEELDDPVAPSAGAPTLVSLNPQVVALAGYTEQALTGAQHGQLFYNVKNAAGALREAAADIVDHLYVAATSQRLPTAVFADTGSVGGVPLTASTPATGIVLPGDFGQLAGVRGPTGPTGPG